LSSLTPVFHGDQAVFTFCNDFKDNDQTRREWPQLYIM
jgi:hypothetical protein